VVTACQRAWVAGSERPKLETAFRTLKGRMSICIGMHNGFLHCRNQAIDLFLRSGVQCSRDWPVVIRLFRMHQWRRSMKPFVASIAAIIGLGLLTAGPVSARGPGGGGGFGAHSGTSNAPRAGHVAAPYGLYTARPYNPGPAYGPAVRTASPNPSAPSSSMIPLVTPAMRSTPRLSPRSLYSGPNADYYCW
jgi:hypothetical protein